MNTEIVIALISLVASCVAPVLTFVTSVKTGKDISRVEMKSSILQMILEDQFGWQAFKKFPTNYQNILHDFDIYTANGGNSYMKKKVTDYCEWYSEIEKESKKKK